MQLNNSRRFFNFSQNRKARIESGVVPATFPFSGSDLSTYEWYVPSECLLAYQSLPVNFDSPIAKADQTLWHITSQPDGRSFGGHATITLANADGSHATIPLPSKMNGTVSANGDAWITFTVNGLTTIAVGIETSYRGVPAIEMQMITGGNNYKTHWAYMVQRNPADKELPPLQVDGYSTLSNNWSWMSNTSWIFSQLTIDNQMQSGNFTISGFQNGYFWGTGNGSESGDFNLQGSVTPEGSLLLGNLAGKDTLTMAIGALTGDATASTMSVSTYDLNGISTIVETITMTSLAAALTPIFVVATSTADGFTVQISNYNGAFTYGGTATAGSVSISETGLVTVSRVGANTSSTATITTTRANYVSGSAQVTATSNIVPLDTATPSPSSSRVI
ncbi:MAG: hypothetical protein RL553_823 [Planctomycetota bacterium]|jgi:hypothetical protein